jgi:hypothetical protein
VALGENNQPEFPDFVPPMAGLHPGYISVEVLLAMTAYSINLEKTLYQAHNSSD